MTILSETNASLFKEKKSLYLLDNMICILFNKKIIIFRLMNHQRKNRVKKQIR